MWWYRKGIHLNFALLSESSKHKFALIAIELCCHVPYSAPMTLKPLPQYNPHLRNAKGHQRALRASVLSSIAIEGVRNAAECALNLASSKVIGNG